MKYKINRERGTKVCSRCLVEKILADFPVRTERNGVSSHCKDCKKETKQPPLKQTWYRMKKRCFNKKDQDYNRYGGRGIIVCKQWLVYQNFHDWCMANGYSEDLTIDRINNDGNYDPSNCRWATRKEQSVNKSDNVFIEYNGETKTLSQWSESTGILRPTLYGRASKGWPPEKILDKSKCRKSISG